MWSLMRTSSRAALVALPVVLALTAAQAAGAATVPPPKPPSAPATALAAAPPSATAPTAANPSVIQDPAQVLPKGWQTSTDRVVTTIGDDNGLNVLSPTP